MPTRRDVEQAPQDHGSSSEALSTKRKRQPSSTDGEPGSQATVNHIRGYRLPIVLALAPHENTRAHTFCRDPVLLAPIST